jgi:hypothetical protein
MGATDLADSDRGSDNKEVNGALALVKFQAVSAGTALALTSGGCSPRRQIG